MTNRLEEQKEAHAGGDANRPAAPHPDPKRPPGASLGLDAGQRGPQGRLSLSLQVAPAAGDLYSDFTFNGQAGGAEPQLDVRYARRQSASLWTVGVLLGL